MSATRISPGNPFDSAARDVQRAKGLSTPEERAAAAPDIDALHRDGYLILHDMLTPEETAAIRGELERLHQSTPLGRTDFEGFHSKRVYNLIAKTRLVDALCTHPRVIAIAEGYLADQIQITAASALTILPEETEQGLHRDDNPYPLPRPRPPLILGTLWAIDPFTRENGATLLVPGSHKALGDDIPEEEPIQAEMPAGSVLLYDGGIWHGGGANRSDSQRAAINLSYNCAWLRQQENQFLAVPRDTVRLLSRPLQRLLGYTTASIMLGYVDGRSPMHQFDEPG